jgi:hypothetical protein
MTVNEHPFLRVSDPEQLLPDERELYLVFWASRTPNERLIEAFRLNRAKWGDEVFDRGVDKTRFEIIAGSDYRR